MGPERLVFGFVEELFVEEEYNELLSNY